ncbi:MAG: sigma-70 family RNA polymerase sigma factor [Anaerolineae bacterium]|nr:sigma-70 family RNA polymerase sigma factor [Anaerolineae bacterium]
MTEQWVLMAQQGTQEERKAAFDQLVLEHQATALRVALSILRDHHQAEDAVQEAFLTAYLSIDQLRDPAAFSGWLNRIVRTHCYRLVRGKIPVQESLEIAPSLATDSPTPESLIESAEMRSQIQLALDALPEHERAVTQGFYIEGQSQREIAERLEVPVSTVKKRLQYAREHLRLLVDELNAAVDDAIARVLKPQPTPQQQPVYIYNRTPESPEDEPEF